MMQQQETSIVSQIKT